MPVERVYTQPTRQVSAFGRCRRCRRHAGRRPAPGRRAGCARRRAPGVRKVHALGVYEGTYTNRKSHGSGQVVVRVKGSGPPIVLALASYSSVEWVVVSGGHRVAAVLLAATSLHRDRRRRDHGPAHRQGLRLRGGRRELLLQFPRIKIARYTGSRDFVPSRAATRGRNSAWGRDGQRTTVASASSRVPVPRTAEHEFTGAAVFRYAVDQPRVTSRWWKYRAPRVRSLSCRLSARRAISFAAA